MKKLIAFATATLISLSADYHDPSVTFNIDNRDTKFFYQLDFHLKHQSTFELDGCNAIILHALSNPRFDKSCHHELGVGYRRMYENFGFGTNIVYAHQYANSFFNHNFVPGLEFFYKDLRVTYNRYLPVKTTVQSGDETYLFHDVSEISLSYRLWQTIQLDFTPYFNHQTKRYGYGGSVSTFVFDTVELALTPYCEPQVQHGITFSIGYHFGGAKEKVNAPLSKSHRFFFTKNKKEVAKFTPNPTSVILPMPAPIILKPVPVENKPGKDQKNWWNEFFGWKSGVGN